MPDQMFAERTTPAWQSHADGLHEILSTLPECGQHEDLPDGLAARIHQALLDSPVPFPEDATSAVQYAERGYELDEALEGLYDWADRERVWLGPRHHRLTPAPPDLKGHAGHPRAGPSRARRGRASARGRQPIRPRWPALATQDGYSVVISSYS